MGFLGACPRLDESTAAVLGVARSSDPFRGMLKKAASCVLGLLACSRTPCTLRAPSLLRRNSYEGRERLRPCLWKGASWRAWVGRVRQRAPRLREGMLFEQPMAI